MTLQALADYYGLNPEFLFTLAGWSARGLGGAQLQERVRERAHQQLGPEVAQDLAGSPREEVELAMRLARAPQSPLLRSSVPGSGRMHEVIALLQPLRGPGVPAASDRERTELLAAVSGLVGLDRRRRRLVADLIEQLHEAQAGTWSRSEMQSGFGSLAERASGEAE